MRAETKLFRIVTASLVSLGIVGAGVLAPAASYAAAPSSGVSGTVAWQIDDAGVLTFGGGELGCGDWPKSEVTALVFSEPVTPCPMLSALFSGYSHPLTISGVDKVQTSTLTSASGAFQGTRVTHALDLNSWDMSSITSLSSMFAFASIPDLDISGWNVSGVSNMDQLFFMFEGSDSLDLSSWNTQNLSVASSLAWQASFETIDLSGWNLPNLTSLSGVVGGDAVRVLNLSGWNATQVTSGAGLFSSGSLPALEVLNISGWETPHLAGIQSMFSNSSLRELNMSGWEVTPSGGLQVAFQNASGLERLDLSDWNITGLGMHSAFDGMTGLQELTLGENSCIDTTAGFPGGHTWVGVGTGTVDVPRGPFAGSASELLDQSCGTESAGTYVWQRDATVTFEGGTVDPSTIDTQTGVMLTTPEPNPLAGFLFKGWSLTSNGSPTIGAGSDLFLPAGATTLFAIWEAILQKGKPKGAVSQNGDALADTGAGDSEIVLIALCAAVLASLGLTAGLWGRRRQLRKEAAETEPDSPSHFKSRA